MKKMASFCFKFILFENRKKSNCRIVVELINVRNKEYKVVTYMYKGKDIIKIENSCVACYTYCKDIFYNRIERKNINISIANNF